LIFESILRDRATIADLDKKKSLAKRFDDFLQVCTELDWNDNLQGYFSSQGFTQEDIDYLRPMNLSYLFQQMPRYNLDQFWNVPVKTLVYRTAYYFSKNGTTETYELLQRIYIKNDIDVAKKIDQFKSQYPGSTYIQRNEDKAINKRIIELIEIIQFDETKEFLKMFNVTNQLNYLTTWSFDSLNKLISKLVYYNIQRDEKNKREYNDRVVDITGKIQLLHSSIYQWSLSCQNVISEKDFSKATFDSISDRCFKLPFSQTAHTLYGFNKEKGRFLGKFDMSSASIIAHSPYQNVSLQPARSFIQKMLDGLGKIEKSKEMPYYEYARSTHILWSEIETKPVSVILERIQGLPWEVLHKAYGISESSLNTLQFIPFINLESIISTNTGSNFLDGIARLRTVSAETIFSGIEHGKVNENKLRAAYKTNVLALCNKPLLSLNYMYLLRLEKTPDRPLYKACEEMFGLKISEFLEYFTIRPQASSFFEKTSLKNFALLLGLKFNGMLRFSPFQIIEQIKPEWTFAEAMLQSPMGFIEMHNSTLEKNLRYSLPQIVDSYHAPIDSAQAFTAYIKVWSRSEDTARIVKEESIEQLAQRLKIERTVLAGMNIIDIINTVMICK